MASKTERNSDRMIEQIEKYFSVGFFVHHPHSKHLGGSVHVLHQDGWETKKLDANAATADGVITRRELDRQGDVMEPKGVELKAFRQNPIVFFNHMPMFPVGISTRQQKFDDRVEATTKFHEKTREAADIAAMVLDGDIRGLSIGFIPLDVKDLPDEFKPKDKDREVQPMPFMMVGGRHLKKVELVEYSHVTVPAVRGALTTRMEGGKLKSKVIEHLLRRLIEDYGLDEKALPWAPGLQFEHLRTRQVNLQLEGQEFGSVAFHECKAITCDAETGVCICQTEKDMSANDSKRGGTLVGDEEKQIGDDKAAVPYKATPPAPKTRAWDGTAANNRMRSWAAGSGDFDLENAGQRNRFRQGFAFVTGGGTTLADYKLPHHDVLNGELQTVWRGVAAAMAATLGARGGVNLSDSERRSAYNHIRRHYAQFEDVPEPPEFRDYTCDQMIELDFDGVVFLEDAEYEMSDGSVGIRRTNAGNIERKALDEPKQLDDRERAKLRRALSLLRTEKVDDAIRILEAMVKEDGRGFDSALWEQSAVDTARIELALALGWKDVDDVDLIGNNPDTHDIAELPALDQLLDELAQSTVLKAGRVLSSKNLADLKTAHKLLDKVIRTQEAEIEPDEDEVHNGHRRKPKPKDFDQELQELFAAREQKAASDIEHQMINGVSSVLEATSDVATRVERIEESIKLARGKLD